MGKDLKDLITDIATSEEEPSQEVYDQAAAAIAGDTDDDAQADDPQAG